MAIPNRSYLFGLLLLHHVVPQRQEQKLLIFI